MEKDPAGITEKDFYPRNTQQVGSLQVSKEIISRRKDTNLEQNQYASTVHCHFQNKNWAPLNEADGSQAENRMKAFLHAAIDNQLGSSPKHAADAEGFYGLEKRQYKSWRTAEICECSQRLSHMFALFLVLSRHLLITTTGNKKLISTDTWFESILTL